MKKNIIVSVIDYIAIGLVVIGVIAISKNNVKSNSNFIDASARCINCCNGISTFETEDGNLWEYEIDARKNDVYIITFDTLNTAIKTDDKIIKIK